MRAATPRRTRSATPRRRSRGTRSILVLQFDSEKLEADGLDLTPFVQGVALFAGRAKVQIVRATTRDDLHVQLAALAGQVFDVVATIGHSNERGIRIAADTFVSWDAYARYLKPFEPRRLAIIACRAGRLMPTGLVFGGLPKVRRIFATPALANKLLGSVMVLMLPYLLDHPVPARDLLRMLQVGLALAGRQMWEWRRTDWTRTNDNVFAPVLHDLLVRAGGELVALLSGGRRA